ncbi:flagellar hook-length control protein FliK [uncultured Planktomarina sp.]|uniref:flagellar hook-length control protein FliK n=1 Tax=uncultured Planktomarina sp. TaxID=1538529 RepID=UPI0032618411
MDTPNPLRGGGKDIIGDIIADGADPAGTQYFATVLQNIDNPSDEKIKVEADKLIIPDLEVVSELVLPANLQRKQIQADTSEVFNLGKAPDFSLQADLEVALVAPYTPEALDLEKTPNIILQGNPRAPDTVRTLNPSLTLDPEVRANASLNVEQEKSVERVLMPEDPIAIPLIVDVVNSPQNTKKTVPQVSLNGMPKFNEKLDQTIQPLADEADVAAAKAVDPALVAKAVDPALVAKAVDPALVAKAVDPALVAKASEAKIGKLDKNTVSSSVAKPSSDTEANSPISKVMTDTDALKWKNLRPVEMVMGNAASPKDAGQAPSNDSGTGKNDRSNSALILDASQVSPPETADRKVFSLKINPDGTNVVAGREQASVEANLAQTSVRAEPQSQRVAIQNSQNSLAHSASNPLPVLRAAIALNTRDAQWGAKLVAQIEKMHSDGVARYDISLRPKNLGDMQISLEFKGEEAQVRIVTETTSASRVLIGAEDRLSQMLDAAGFRLASFSASMDGGVGQGLGQQGKQKQQSTPGDNKHRNRGADTDANVERTSQLHNGMVNVIA